MKTRAAITLGSALMCSWLAVAGAAFGQQAQFGTAVEAKAMLERAATAIKADRAKAIEVFNNGEGGFRDRDLYPFCFDAKTGIFNAHIVKPMIGTDIRTFKEADGSPLGQKIFDSVKEEAITTVSYHWPRPGGTDPLPKESYVTAVGTQACGVGYYK